LNNTYNKKKHEYRQGDGSVTLHLYLFRFRFLVSVSVTVTVTVTVKVTQDPLLRTLAKIDGWAKRNRWQADYRTKRTERLLRIELLTPIKFGI